MIRTFRRRQCIFYAQGRCKYGAQCFNSHDGYTEALMIRHAQSEFNKAVHLFPGEEYKIEPERSFVHLNRGLIDCGLSQVGQYMCSLTKISEHYVGHLNELDLVFVSPLNRTLQTAEILIKANKIKVGKIIVLAQLTEVMSKICDFSSQISLKKAKYKNYDFRQFKRYCQQEDKQESNWQDSLVDKQYTKNILLQEKNADRYLKVLEEIFPTPLESSERCFKRAMKAMERMKQISEEIEASKILVVSHNRILKYMDGRYKKGRAPSFQNCQIRRLIF